MWRNAFSIVLISLHSFVFSCFCGADSAGSCEDVEIESAMYGSHPAEKQEEDENSGEGQGKEEELEQDIAGEDLGPGRARSYADRSESKVYSSTLHKCEVRNACMLRFPMK